MNDHELFLNNLSKQLHVELPGWLAQKKMSPILRRNHLAYADKLDSARRSGVLLLLYPFRDQLHTVLIKRSEYKGVHSGQISLPGGKQEKVDQNIIATAIRESSEEVNIDPNQVEIVGSLSQLYIPPSNYLVHPVVGFSECRPSFKRQEKEVELIIEIELNRLLDPAIISQKKMKMSNGLLMQTPYFDIDGHIVWGATAMILSEFVHVIKQLP